MKKEEFINMYMNAGQKEKELIESLLKGTQETEKVYKVTDTNGNAVFEKDNRTFSDISKQFVKLCLLFPGRC